MRKFIAGAALALIVGGSGGTAFAGEIGGNGEPTPIKTRFVAGSICAFSGLDDGTESGAGVQPGVTQSWGQVVKGFAREGGVGDVTEGGDLQNFGPGTECRGFASQGG